MRVALLTLVLACVAAVHGAVSFSPIQTEQVYGKTVKFCLWNNIKILPRSVFKDYDSCSTCTCDNDGVNCATLPTAFAIQVPDDSLCISVLIGCKNTWVYRDNPSRRCPKRLIPTEISMVGK